MFFYFRYLRTFTFFLWAGLMLIPAQTHAQGKFVQHSKLTASDMAISDHFGWSVSTQNGTALIGAIGTDAEGKLDCGSAYVFTRSGSGWSQQAKLTALDAEASDLFGFCVSLWGDTALVGAPDDDGSGESSGSAYIFTRTNNTWNQHAKLTALDATSRDYFGRAVAIWDDTAVVGSYGDDDNGDFCGSAYVFTRTDNTWSLCAKLLASDAQARDIFGFSVAIWEDTIIVGSHRADTSEVDAGSAYVFIKNGTQWTQQAKLIASDPIIEGCFGYSIAIYGDTAILGAYGDNTAGIKSGSAYIFTRNGSAWTQQAKLIAPDTAERDHFGWTVAISDNTAVVGAHEDDDMGTGSGSVYIYTRDGSSWAYSTKLTALDTKAGDNFGLSVALEENTLFSSAPNNDSPLADAGAAYVFDLQMACDRTAWMGYQ